MELLKTLKLIRYRQKTINRSVCVLLHLFHNSHISTVLLSITSPCLVFFAFSFSST